VRPGLSALCGATFGRLFRAFIMENLKGLLPSKVGVAGILRQMLSDLPAH
jgi:hypothetical protein